MFADGFPPAGVDLHLSDKVGGVPRQYVTIRGMIEQPKGIREFRERAESPSRNPTTPGFDEAIRRRFPTKYPGSQLFRQAVIVHGCPGDRSHTLDSPRRIPPETQAGRNLFL
jgi:hypothetical protein